MSHLALELVLVSALLHAVWNLLLKGQSQKLSFSLAAMTCGLAVFGVPCAVEAWRGGLSPAAVPWAVLSGLVHVAYFTCLSRAYDAGDLSFAYPAARGGAALLVPILAWAFVAERPDLWGTVGVALIVVGLAVLQWGALRQGVSRAAAGWAMATAATIAAYSLIDKVGVGLAQPLVYWYMAATVSAVGLAVVVAGRRELGELRVLAGGWRPAAAVGTMIFATYILVLFALRVAPVIYVYPARQVSLAMAVLLGALVRREPALRRRLVGALVIGLGTVLLGSA